MRLDHQVFVQQMMRLSAMFDPGRFEGQTGKIRSQDYWLCLRHSHTDDLVTAVDNILAEWPPTSWERFPVPATILESVRSAAVERQSRRAKLQLVQAPTDDTVNAGLQKIISDLTTTVGKV